MSTLTASTPAEGVRPHRWTREAYERLVEAGAFHPESRAQLIDGEIIEMSPQGSRHATAIRKIENALRSVFREGYDVRSQLPLALGAHSEPEPDVAVVEGRLEDYVATHPTHAVLVVEVSDSTLAFDRTRKLAVYACESVPEYWIVNLVDDAVEIYRQPAGDTYAQKTTLRAGETLVPPAAPEPGIPVADLLP